MLHAWQLVRALCWGCAYRCYTYYDPIEVSQSERSTSRGSTHGAHKSRRSQDAVSEGVARGALGSERRFRKVGLPLALGRSEDPVVDAQAGTCEHGRCSD